MTTTHLSNGLTRLVQSGATVGYGWTLPHEGARRVYWVIDGAKHVNPTVKPLRFEPTDGSSLEITDVESFFSAMEGLSFQDPYTVWSDLTTQSLPQSMQFDYGTVEILSSTGSLQGFAYAHNPEASPSADSEHWVSFAPQPDQAAVSLSPATSATPSGIESVQDFEQAMAAILNDRDYTYEVFANTRYEGIVAPET